MRYLPWDASYLEALCELWNRELGARFPMRPELFRQNSFADENVLDTGSWIACDPDTLRPVGFVVAKCWQERLELQLGNGAGWIQVLLVANEYRGRGIGSELLARAEEALRRQGVQSILLGRDPYHYFPGIPEESQEVKAWFAQRGYVELEPLENDLLCHYPDSAKAELPYVSDGCFRQLTVADKEAFLAFLHRCFPGRWEYEAIHYFRRGGEGREFVVLEKRGEIIGFCRMNDSRSPFIAQNVYWAPLFHDELGGIGPLGVDSAHRGQGFGLAMVEAGITILRKRGIKQIVIDWTTLVDFYAKLGYHSWKQYAKFRKDFG
ncbi:GNAT family N-acetyltransferase [Brevibacillus reuszeri]|uniref:GNAT family N-acetyltransferase n=1 Tax=Brevibacillus reuszeri TaxID=54915 RepID=UPI00289CE2B5|nr:GNAT family N-acetyltransferase [Brevibacillus reuszeri]